MMNPQRLPDSPMLRLALRGAGIAIALLAVLDPEFQTSGTDRETVAVVAADAGADSSAAARVRSVLAGDYIMVPMAFAGAHATVVVGEAIPAGSEELAGPAFAVVPGGVAPRINIEAVDAPRRTPLESRIAVNASVRVRGARGRALELTLRSGELAVARTSRRVTSNDERVLVPFTFAPATYDPAHLRVQAVLSGARADSASADVVIAVTREPWRVLFHDARPSWTSTFVRRVAERDPRFTVASRIATTRNVASDAGRPPRLDDRATLDGMGLVVVGAPDALAANEVTALEAFMRRRGGSVVLLLDTPPPLGTWDLGLGTGVEWRHRSGGEALSIARAPSDSNALRAIELAWPARLPSGAEPIAVARALGTWDLGLGTIIWASSVGAGRLVVSGALDSWRFRDASLSAFDAFWRELLANEAGRALSPVEVAVSPAVLAPGDRAIVSVVLREPAIAAASPNGWSGEPLRASVAAGAGNAIHLWPTAGVGVLTGELRAPNREGPLEVRVIAGRDTAVVPVVVRAGARSAVRGNAGALAAWTTSTGGRSFTDAELGQLSGAIRSAISPEVFTRPWHPMRSPWWIVPFALLLSAEWWMRRRSGLA